MVPALSTFPLTVALLNVTQGIVVPVGLVKPALLPEMTVLHGAAIAGGAPPPTSSALADAVASNAKRTVHPRTLQSPLSQSPRCNFNQTCAESATGYRPR